jgi:hypothetical protein
MNGMRVREVLWHGINHGMNLVLQKRLLSQAKDEEENFRRKTQEEKGQGPEMRERVERRTHARERVIYIIDDWGRTKPKNESVFNAASEARKMEVARDSMLSSGIASQRQPQQVHLGIGTEFLA